MQRANLPRIAAWYWTKEKVPPVAFVMACIEAAVWLAPKPNVWMSVGANQGGTRLVQLLARLTC
jgi:hypothetical protein